MAHGGAPNLKESDLANLGRFESDSESEVNYGLNDQDGDSAMDDGSDSDSLNAHKLEIQKREKQKEQSMREVARTFGRTFHGRDKDDDDVSDSDDDQDELEQAQYL